MNKIYAQVDFPYRIDAIIYIYNIQLIWCHRVRQAAVFIPFMCSDDDGGCAQ